MTTSVSRSTLDSIYRKIVMSKFFTQGWGEPEKMKKILSYRKIMSDKAKCNRLVASDYPVTISGKTEETDLYVSYNGYLRSPMVDYLGDMMPPEVHTAHFELILPKKWSHPTLKPLCLHLAGTGDHGYWKRRLVMAKPLIKEAQFGSIILENPFYGSRKPPEQDRSALRNVSDIFIMGGCLIVESIALFNWCRLMGFGPLCVTGISMGGHMASLAGASWNRPISIVPCLSWTTASCVFTQGVMSASIPWDVLEAHYMNISENIRTELQLMVESPEENDVFEAGKQFAKELTREVEIAVKSNPSSQPSTTSSSTMASILSGEILMSAIGLIKPSLVRNGQPTASDRAKTDVINFMRGIMDEFTHLGNFSRPMDSELATIVSASCDGYVPQANVTPLTEIWKGSQHKVLNCGHVAAIVWYLDVFRKAIIESMELQARKYYDTSLSVTQESVRNKS